MNPPPRKSRGDGLRVLFSLEGTTRGWTKQATVTVAYDHLHVFSPEPEAEQIEELERLATMAGGSFSAEAVPSSDLMAAFQVIVERLRQHEDEDAVCQVNAGKDANLLSAAGLLACLHTGVEAHFVDEAGHTRVPVLTRWPLDRLLGEDQQAALASFPAAGLHVSEVEENDPGALSGLRKRGVIELEGDRLQLTEIGRAYQAHLT